MAQKSCDLGFQEALIGNVYGALDFTTPLEYSSGKRGQALILRRAPPPCPSTKAIVPWCGAQGKPQGGDGKKEALDPTVACAAV